MSRFARALWPLVLWMAVVFLMSTDIGAANHTSRFLGPLLHWLNPDISHEALMRAHFLFRKAGHLTEYAVLALLVLRALHRLRPVKGGAWSWRLALLSLLASAAYGATDEFHQLFVASRGASVTDVLIDSSGALLGLLLAFLWRSVLRGNRRTQGPDLN